LTPRKKISDISGDSPPVKPVVRIAEPLWDVKEVGSEVQGSRFRVGRTFEMWNRRSKVPGSRTLNRERGTGGAVGTP
jgi:hypothetical protein